MLSPMMTVVVLVVLWLIVVVPMLVRRNDAKRRERSVDGFGRAMRALGRRADDAEVFVHTAEAPEAEADPAPTSVELPRRRPVPAAQEALMHPVDRSEMSAARAQMMARRRRSLSILGGGTFLFLLLSLVMGGAMWVLGLGFLAGLGGYLYFLRSQALRDRTRRQGRQDRAARQHVGVDATAEAEEFADEAEHGEYVEHDEYVEVATAWDEQFPEAVESAVRIDDDDIELNNLDTIDLTGVYEEAVEATQRRAS